MTSDHGAGRKGPGFDAVLRTFRLRAQLTQEELAARAAVGVRTVRDLERGRASRPQRTTVELLAAALGLTGAERLAFLSAARGRRTDAPPPLNRLPPPTDLIGRDADVDELTSAEAWEGSRGITLVGLAGVGKSSLALAVAHRGAAGFPGGVAHVVVTDAATADELLGAVAAAFGVARPDDLGARFADRPALLVADAVERAPDAVAEALSRLLRRHPELRFLAAGRHPIGLAAERVRPVEPLPGPAAVDLFLDKIMRVRGNAVGPSETPAIATLVRRLGGLPLALELAAARGRVLTVTEILDRYGDRVLDLTGRPTDGGEVSVREAVAASYRLLTADERAALHRLAVFRTRWSLDLAEKVIDARPATDVVHLLDRFLELGLVGARGARSSRFHLLDVVGDYALEQAAAQGDLRAARQRHAEVMAETALAVAPELEGPRLADAAARLDDLAADLAAALGWAAQEDPHTALRLAARLPRWWRIRGRDVTGRQSLHRLLADPRTSDAPPEVRAWARIGLSQLALEHGAGAEEIDSARAALTDFEALGDLPGQFTAHSQLAALWMVARALDRAHEHAARALDLARSSGRLRDMAVAENNLMWHDLRRGDLPAARARLAAVDRLASRCGEHRLRAIAAANLAELERLDGRLDEAARLGRDAIAELDFVGDPSHRRRVLRTIGQALAETGRLPEAEEVLTELRTHHPGEPQPDAHSLDGPTAAVDAAIALHRGDHKRATESFELAAAASETDYDVRDALEALLGLTRSATDPDTQESARRRLTTLCRTNHITLLPREQSLLDTLPALDT